MRQTKSKWYSVCTAALTKRCATEGCEQDPYWVLEAGGVSSVYCVTCRDKIEDLTEKRAEERERLLEEAAGALRAVISVAHSYMAATTERHGPDVATVEAANAFLAKLEAGLPYTSPLQCGKPDRDRQLSD